MSAVVRAVRAFFARFPAAEPGILAVSGGTDSVALLRAIVEAGIEHLAVGHFNHRLRGAESDADAEFVRELARNFDLPFHLGEADVAAEAVGENLEATARKLRYDWLGRTATAIGAVWIATGHTADDQAETVLHRLIRGTGIQGFRGIAADRELALGVRLVRPVLGVTRGDILAYLESLGQTFQTDSSNADSAFTRNRIRHEVLPLLRTFNPEIVTVLGRVAEQATDAFRVLTQAAETLRASAERPRAGGTLVFAVEPLLSADPYLVREMFRLVWDREGWSSNGMSAEHWNRVLAVALGELPACDFPAGIHVRRVGAVVQLLRRSKK